LTLRLVTTQPQTTLVTALATRSGAARLDESRLRHDAAAFQELAASRTNFVRVPR
jgi:hypothetical protein